MNFNGITHIIECPKGHAEGYNFFLAGHVPAALMDLRPATASDVMAGRAFTDSTGALVAPRTRRWGTVAEVVEAAKGLPGINLHHAGRKVL